MSEADPTAKVAEVTWEAPPIPQKYDWSKIADQLRDKPMEWARIFDRDRSSIVVAIRNGNVGDVHPDLGFETSTTNNTRETPRTCSLYMRYNPEKERSLSALLRQERKKDK